MQYGNGTEEHVPARKGRHRCIKRKFVCKNVHRGHGTNGKLVAPYRYLASPVERRKQGMLSACRFGTREEDPMTCQCAKFGEHGRRTTVTEQKWGIN